MAAPTTEPDLYADPERFRWAGSMEGLPDAAAPSEDAWQDHAREGLAFITRILPGVAIAALLAYAAGGASQWLGVSAFGFDARPSA